MRKILGFAPLLMALGLLANCGNRCGSGEQSVRILRAGVDGKVYEQLTCVPVYQPPPAPVNTPPVPVPPIALPGVPGAPPFPNPIGSPGFPAKAPTFPVPRTFPTEVPPLPGGLPR